MFRKVSLKSHWITHQITRWVIAFALLLGAFSLPVTNAFAADGNPVPSFGVNGQFVFDPSIYNNSGYAVVPLVDGKILVGVYNAKSQNNDPGEFIIARVTSAGSLDTTFGVGGYARAGFGAGGWSALGDIAVMNDGRIVAVGTYQPAGQQTRFFAVARFCPEGALDTGSNCPALTPKFGATGMATTALHAGGINNSIALGVALQTDGKIIAAGLTTTNAIPYMFALARYNLNGSLDSTFGAGGIVRANITDYVNYFQDVLIDSHGKIVAAGFAKSNADHSRFAIARFNANGTLDASFSSDGLQNTRIGEYSEANALALQADGKLVVAGSAYANYVNGRKGFAVARYNTDGSLDYTFNATGRKVDYFNASVQFDDAYTVALDQDGRILIGGNTYTDGSRATRVIASARLCPDGSLDHGAICSSTGYGSGGKALVGDPAEFDGTIHSLVARASDKAILAAGEVHTGTKLKPFLMLLEGDGDLTHAISGNTGVGGVTLSYTDGVAKSVTSAGNGDYAIEVSYNWSGTVTPSRVGYAFTPLSRSYSNVVDNLTNQDYAAAAATTYTISGNAGVGGVTLSYGGLSASSAPNGDYSLIVPSGWTGAVTPARAGFTFTPANRSYSNVSSNHSSQNYSAAYQAPTAQAGGEKTYSSFIAKWSAVPGATGYYLDVATNAAFTQFVSGHNNLFISGGGITSILVDDLKPQTQYYYRLRAATGGAVSANSNAIQVKTDYATFLPIIRSDSSQ